METKLLCPKPCQPRSQTHTPKPKPYTLMISPPKTLGPKPVSHSTVSTVILFMVNQFASWDPTFELTQERNYNGD